MTYPDQARLFALAALVLILATPASASAFDYLEHSFLTDRACYEVQQRLGGYLREHPDEQVAARYLALALVCPERWDRPYCSEDYKLAEGNLNLLSEAPAESGDHSVTLGDFAALPDHLSQWGALGTIPQAASEGVTSEVLSWFDGDTEDVGGVIADVAEDACETGGRVDWDNLERDLQVGLAESTAWQPLPEEAMVSSRRAPLNRGPNDPAAAYSFDNPHYLDLVLLNHHHFNEWAHASWVGFHTVADAVAGQRCEELVKLDEDDFEDLSDDLDGFSDVDWDMLPDAEMRERGCAAIAARLRQRLSRWSERAASELVAPARPWLERAEGDGAFMDRVTSATLAMIFEGAGIHYLQDSLAGGHLRMNRAAYDLELARHMHDADGRQGINASFGSRSGERRFVAFGDSWVLGRSPASLEGPCAWGEVVGEDPEAVSACLLRAHRGLLMGTTMASLLDFAFGGILFAAPQDDVGDACTRDPLRAFVCDHLPTRPTIASGLGQGGPGAPSLQPGDLPEPPPPFSYQSISLSTSLDGGGDAVQTGVRLVFLSEIDNLANWMASYHFGLLNTRRFEAPPELLTEFSYMFHWRWAARFLINLGPFAYGGLRGFGPGVSVFGGVAPSVGLTLLPEGWIKLPVEISMSYRMPLTLIDSAVGLTTDAIQIEAHWIELTVGLAFL